MNHDTQIIMPPQASTSESLVQETPGNAERVKVALDSCTPLQLRYLGYRHQGYNHQQASDLISSHTNVTFGWRDDSYFRCASGYVIDNQGRNALGRDLAKRIAIARAPHHVLNLDSLSINAHRDSDKIAASDKLLQVAEMYPRAQGTQVAVQINVIPGTVAPVTPDADSGY